MGRKRGEGERASRRGVYVLKATIRGKVRYRGKWWDPDACDGEGGWRYELIDGERTNAEQRAQWAKEKEDELLLRGAQLRNGAPRKSATTVKGAVEAFLASKEGDVREKTITLYRESLDPFVAWCTRKKITKMADLGTEDLTAFRAYLAKRPSKNGGGKRSPHSVNRDLRHVRIFLNHARLHDWILVDGLKIPKLLASMRTEREEPEILDRDFDGEIEKLLRASMKHDRETHSLTREEKARGVRPGEGGTTKYEAIAPFVATVLLTGARVGEVEGLEWDDVHLDAEEIRLPAAKTKTGIARTIDLAVSPTVTKLLRQLRLQAGENPYVFGQWQDEDEEKGLEAGWVPMPHTLAESTRKRLVRTYGAPRYTWHQLRRTCGSFLTCAPAIYGAASAFLSAKRLGHSVAIAERSYAAQKLRIDPDAKTLEQAMKIEDAMKDVLRAAGVVGEKETAAAAVAS